MEEPDAINDTKGPPVKYRKIPHPVTAIEMREDNWNEVCELVRVGHLTEGRPQGCWVTPDGLETIHQTAERGLRVPSYDGVALARRGDWLVIDQHGDIDVVGPLVFQVTYEPVPPIVPPVHTG
jgi:hypothetical protein